MRASVKAVLAASFSFLALGAAQAAADKSTKPRLAVLEFADRAAGPTIHAATWGEWIADVERPPAAGGWARADGLAVTWDVPGDSGIDGGGQADALTDGLLVIRYAHDAPAAKVNKVEALTIKQKVVEGAAPRANDRLRNAGPKDGWKAEGGVTVAAGDVTGDGAAASGQATGKRQHRPIRLRTYAAPLPRGSLLIRLAQPWPACSVGDRFNGAYLTIGASHRYRLDGATVVGCSDRAVAINYATVARPPR
jgi:hypothetical protein